MAKMLRSRRLTGIVIGRLVDVAPTVDFLGNEDAPLAARTLVPLAAGDAGREVALMFEDGDPRRPLVLGLIQVPVAAKADGEALVFSARREIVLRCGRASITLTRAGKILIRGTYVSSRSSGVNRIKGGSVQIN